MNLYLLTDWLSLIPVFIMLCFAVIGLMQWIRRRHILKADADLLLLGVFYIVVLGAYLLFEQFPVNYRPVLIDGILEASYPSSTTLLILTCMPTAVMQVFRRIGNSTVRKLLGCFMTVFAFLMVLGRLMSGVHWLTDIIGGILLSISLVEMYFFAVYALNQTDRYP
jgi:undecaprenyl-diphosphatase